MIWISIFWPKYNNSWVGFNSCADSWNERAKSFGPKGSTTAMVADIIKIENLPTFSGQKTDKLIGFSVVGF